MERIIERTDDGSATLFVPELNEHYHSTKGARTESQHIFIDMGLKASPAATPRVLEIGFGTGRCMKLLKQFDSRLLFFFIRDRAKRLAHP